MRKGVKMGTRKRAKTVENAQKRAKNCAKSAKKCVFLSAFLQGGCANERAACSQLVVHSS